MYKYLNIEHYTFVLVLDFPMNLLKCGYLRITIAKFRKYQILRELNFVFFISNALIYNFFIIKLNCYFYTLLN